MNCFLGFSIILLIICYECAASKEIEDISEEDEMRPEYCTKQRKDECIRLHCNKNNTKSYAMGCSNAMCPGDTLDYGQENLSKPFPDCCPVVVCATESNLDYSTNSNEIVTPQSTPADIKPQTIDVSANGTTSSISDVTAPDYTDDIKKSTSTNALSYFETKVTVK